MTTVSYPVTAIRTEYSTSLVKRQENYSATYRPGKIRLRRLRALSAPVNYWHGKSTVAGVQIENNHLYGNPDIIPDRDS